MGASEDRKRRRALGRLGVEVVHTVTIDGAATAAAVVQGVDLVDLVMFQVDAALRVVDEQGGDILTHAVVTIGRHPEHPDDLTVQAKTDVRKAVSE